MTERIEEVSDASEWNAVLERSRDATPFHLAECLQVCAEYANARLHRYVGYKGQEPTGLFPIFELGRGPFTAVFSPPPGLKIPYLGPALVTPDGLKRRKRERWNRSFVESVLERIVTEIGPRYWQVRTSPKYVDHRPFLWDSHDETLRYTYVVDLTNDEQALLDSFSSDARRNVADVEHVELADGGRREAERIVERVANRHAEQNVAFGLDPAFVGDLYRRLPDGCMRVHVCRRGDRFLGGDVTLELGDTVYGWLGAGDHSSDLPVNDILYGALLCDTRRRGYETYDMVGANDPRLSTYKAKFGPELRTYTRLVRRGITGRVASSLYALVR